MRNRTATVAIHGQYIPPLEIRRDAVEENTGEKFSFPDQAKTLARIAPALFLLQTDGVLKAGADANDAAQFAELETLGLLTHPHTSAGRVPTESGYGFGDTVLRSSLYLLPLAVLMLLASLALAALGIVFREELVKLTSYGFTARPDQFRPLPPARPVRGCIPSGTAWRRPSQALTAAIALANVRVTCSCPTISANC